MEAVTLDPAAPPSAPPGASPNTQPNASPGAPPGALYASLGVTPAAPLCVAVVDTEAGLAALAGEWNALFERAGCLLPFRHHDWAVAWWAHLRRRRARCRDRLRVFVVRDAAGALAAVAPCVLTTYGLTAPGGAGVGLCRVLQPMGADPNLTELRGLLAAPGLEAAAVAAVAAHVARRRDHDWVRWAGLERDGPAHQTLAAQPGAQADDDVSAFVLPLPASWDEFRRTRPRNVRESLRKCYNSLARDGHAWRFTVVDDAAGVHAALGRYFDLHGSRASQEVGVRHRDYFADPAARRFVEAVVARFGARGAARMFQLEVAGEVVAMRLGFQLGPCLYLYYSGYDPAWGRYGVMTTVVAETIRTAIEGGLAAVHLSTGSDVSKTRWRPEEQAFAGVSVPARGPRARLAYAAFEAAKRRSARAADAAGAAAPNATPHATSHAPADVAPNAAPVGAPEGAADA